MIEAVITSEISNCFYETTRRNVQNVVIFKITDAVWSKIRLWSGSLYTGSYHASSLFSRFSAVWQVEGRQPNSRACGKRAGERIRRRRPNTVVIDRASRAHALHCVPRHGPSLTMAYPPAPSCPGTASQLASQSHLTPRSAVGVARKTDAWRQHQRARVRWGQWKSHCMASCYYIDRPRSVKRSTFSAVFIYRMK
jgi:hypothetical protein